MGKNSNRRRNKSRSRRLSFTEDTKDYGKRQSHYDPLCCKTDKCSGNVKKKYKSYKRDVKSNRDYRYQDISNKRKYSNSNYFESPVKKERRSKFDDFYNKNNLKKTKSQRSCSRLVLSRSISPVSNLSRAVIDTKIPFIPIVQLDKKWKSECGNRTTVYSLSDFQADFSRTSDVDPNIIDGYEYERIHFENYLRRINNFKIDNSKENFCKRSNNRSSPPSSTCRDRQDSLPEVNDDVPNSSYNRFLPSSKGLLENSRMKQVSNVVARSYRYERCQASTPVTYKRTLEYKDEKRSSFINNSINDIAYDPITKNTLTKNLMFRSFEDVNSPVDVHSSCIFSLKSYNILSQAAAMNHPEMYTHLKIIKDNGQVEMDSLLLEDNRYKKLLSELTTYTSDILCLQECDQIFYDNMLKSEMEKNGFKGEFLLKSSPDSQDGCATFYSDKFKLVNKKDVRFLEFIAGHEVKPQIAQILEFELNSDNDKLPEDKTRLFVANTHILYNPKRGDIKLSQVACLLANLQDMINQCKNPYAYIMCGDFNMQPYSRMYNFIVDGKCDHFFDRATFSGQISSKTVVTSRVHNKLIRGSLFDHSCRLVNKEAGDYYGPYTHRLSFASVYKHYTGKQKKPEISTYHTCDASNPDYIFYGVSLREVDKSVVYIDETSKLSLIKRLSLPSDSEIAQNLGPMPNSFTGSDHLPLLAQFQLR